ncbi:hypothetical protein N9926_00940 [Flavobacteriaceae bacterium]|nr:hypothetical protein [Flavobacteriaceae bacterium]
MAYFNHAFCKSFLATSVLDANGTATSALTSGQITVVDSGDWESISIATGYENATGHLHLVQGSLRTNDNIGNNPGHGGYSESVKSKGINPKYISRLASSAVLEASNSSATLSVGSDCAPCGENFFVRVDVKGSPALRFLNHNAYAIGDSSGDAAANGGDLPAFLCCTVDGQTHVDPAVALAAAMQMVLADPIISPFVQEAGASIAVTGAAAQAMNGAATLGAVSAGGATYVTATNVATTGGTGTGLTLDITAVAGAVTAVAINNPGNSYTALDAITITGGDGAATTTVATVAAAGGAFTITEMLDGTYTASTDPVGDVVSATVTVEGAYVDTSFGNCSFDTRDFYEKEPVKVILSVLDETGNPCNDCGVSTETAGQMPNTLGEKVMRDLILTDRYAQMPYNQGTADSARIREIEGSADMFANVTRSSLYKVYYLQHNVPRFNNPSSVFDNDQYLYQVFVLSTDTAGIAAMDAMMAEFAVVSGIAFEQDI